MSKDRDVPNDDDLRPDHDLSGLEGRLIRVSRHEATKPRRHEDTKIIASRRSAKDEG